MVTAMVPHPRATSTVASDGQSERGATVLQLASQDINLAVAFSATLGSVA